MTNNSNDENVQRNVFAFTQPILAEDGSGKYKLELYERDSNRFGGESCLCKFYVYPSDWDRASIALRNLTREYNKHHSRPYIIIGDRKRIVESVKKIER